MADADFTLTSNTWWSTNPAAAGDGSSFAQRKAIPTGVGTGILNMVVNADVNFTLVLEVQSGAIVLGNNAVAAKTFTCYGGLYTVDANNLPIHPGNTSAFRCAIGGTTGYKEGVKALRNSKSFAANIDFGQDSAGNPTSNANFGLQILDGYYYNCTNKEYVSYRGALLYGGVFESTTLYGSNSGAGYVFAPNGRAIITFITCTLSSSFTSWGYYFAVGVTINIIGGLTITGGGLTQLYLDANTQTIFKFYRRAFVKVTTDGTTALSGAAFSAYEATGGVDMPLSSGVTGATGLCKPQSPTIYNDSIWALQKVETYIRTTAGAMTWGTPTSTVTYGSYTHTFSKSGYVTQTQTHDFTDGADWGTVGSPIAITMVKQSAIPTPIGNPFLSLFSDAPCTTKSSTITVGQTGYINGGVNLQGITSGDTRTATTLIQIRKVSDDSVMATLYNAADVLDGDSDYSYKDSSEFGGGTAYNFDTTGYTPGEYYIMVSTTGTDITTEFEIEYFQVVAVPVLSWIIQIWQTPCSDAGLTTPKTVFYPGESIYFDGSMRGSKDWSTPGGESDSHIYDSSWNLVEDLSVNPLSGFFLSGATVKLEDIFIAVETLDTTGYAPGQYWYEAVIRSPSGVIAAYIDIPFTIEALPKAVFSTDYFLYASDVPTGAVPTPTIIQGDSLRLSGQVTLSGADTVDNDIDILLYKADGTLVETIPTSQFSSSDGVTQDLDTIFGGIFTKDTTLLDPGAYYYLMNIGGSDIEEALQIIAEFEVVVTGAAPFISNVAMTQSSITQASSTKITFDASNMISTDFCYVEAVGKGVIKRCTTSDNLHYSLTLYGADLPVMTANMLTISAINVGGSDTDSTLVLTVTAVPATVSAYRLKEAIQIVDEVDLIIKLIETDLLNHRLKHILPFTNIYKEQPTQWKDFPGMYIRKVSNVTMVESESLGEDYDTGVEKIGSVWQCDIAFDIVAHVKTIFNYPPIETDEADSVRFEHAKNCLPIMHQLLHTILSENRQYLDPDGSTLQWDFVEPVPNGYNLIDGGYNGARDVWAIQVLYRFQFEMEVQ